MRPRLTATFLLLAVACGGGPPDEVVTPPTGEGVAAAPLPAPLGLGRPATPEEIAAWDLDVDPSGAGLPDGRGTVAEGAAVYRERCAACHGPAGEGGAALRLVARTPTGGFADDPKLPRAIGNWWPYATTLYDYVRRTMPHDRPGSLAPDQVYAVVAFLLAENGAVGPDFVADRTTLPAVRMPTRVTFVPDDRLQTTGFR